MPTPNDTIAAFVAARDYDAATLSRLGFWSGECGDREVADITPDDVEAVPVRSAERGRLKPACNRRRVPAGKQLAPASINCCISQLGSISSMRAGCA